MFYSIFIFVLTFNYFLVSDDIVYKEITLTRTSHYSAEEATGLTSSGIKPEIGIIALSPDLLKTIDYKTPVLLYDKKSNQIIGMFIVEDKMHCRYKKSADIFVNNSKIAKSLGVKRNVILIYKKK